MGCPWLVHPGGLGLLGVSRLLATPIPGPWLGLRLGLLSKAIETSLLRYQPGKVMPAASIWSAMDFTS
jgi:hypothetical protein